MKKFLKKIRPLIGVILLMAALYFIHNELKKYSYHQITEQLFQITGKNLILSLVLTVINYIFLTFYDLLALQYIRYPLAYRKIALASFIGYVFSFNLTVFGGSAARYRVYSSWGMSAVETAKVVVFCALTFWLGFLTLAGIIFVCLPLTLPKSFHIPLASTVPLGVIFLIIVTAYMLLVILIKKPIKIYGLEIASLGVRLTFMQILVASMDWVFAGSVLYALLPSSGLPFLAFLGIFMLAQFTGLASQIPAGLGAFETVMLFLLSSFYSAPTILGTVLVYRSIYYLLPFTIASAILVSREVMERKKAIKFVSGIMAQLTSTAVPYIFALTIFLGGGILLFSGALPAEGGRLALLRDTLPLPVIEVSHFLASLIGFGLLVLARGLYRRLDAAYYLTLVLLAMGGVFSLLKGLDYEEAIILFVMLLIFLPCRKEFYRKSSLMSLPFDWGWVASVFIVIASSIWLGMFSYKHIEYSHSLWWQFTYSGDAPRFLRATAGVIIGSMIIAATMLLRSSRKPLKNERTTDLNLVKPIVTNSGNTYANLALLGDKTFVLSPSRSSFIMYAVKGQSWITMGDPIGPQEQWEELIWRFSELADSHGCFPVFYEVQAENLNYYSNMGLTSLKIGEEAIVILKDFSLEGQHRSLRYTLQKLRSEGFEFKIIPVEQIPSYMPEFKNISDSWLAHKNTREKGFGLGFFKEDYLENFPAAIVVFEGKPIAFANLWQGAEKKELSIDLMRYLPGIHEGIMDYLFTELMLWGKEQEYQQFNLGMAPLSGLEGKNLASLWPKFGNFVFRYGENFYNFQGLRKYKEKFDPVWQSKYLVCPGGLAVPRILSDTLAITSRGIKGSITK